MSEFHYPYKLNKVQIWFAAQPKVASENVNEFCFFMSPEDAIKYLEAHLTPRALDSATTCPHCNVPYVDGVCVYCETLQPTPSQ